MHCSARSPGRRCPTPGGETVYYCFASLPLYASCLQSDFRDLNRQIHLNVNRSLRYRFVPSVPNVVGRILDDWSVLSPCELTESCRLCISICGIIKETLFRRNHLFLTDTTRSNVKAMEKTVSTVPEALRLSASSRPPSFWYSALKSKQQGPHSTCMVSNGAFLADCTGLHAPTSAPTANSKRV